MQSVRSGLVLSTLMVGCAGAWAQSQDVVSLRSTLGILNNDNFFSANANPVSERVTSQTIGVRVAIPEGLQRFELDASLTGNQHQTYTSFDYIAQNYSAGWMWSVTPQFHGSLTSTRTESLNAATDSANPNLRNKNTTQNTALSAVYELGGPWQVTGGVSSSNSINERALIGQADNRSTAANVGARYVLGSGNMLAYSLQTANGNNINDYTSVIHDFSGVWVLTGNTTLNGRIAQMQQRYGATPQYDFSGVSGAVSVVWRVSGKISLNAGWQRDLASYQTAGTTHTQTDAFSIGPSWQISPKTAVRFQHRNAVRDDQGNPAGVPGTRQDRLQDTSITFSWQPRPLATLSATLGEANRSSNIANTDFVARTFSVNALFNF